jgi:hypothetical protein
MVFALIVFILSLAGIIALFSLKYWETQHARVLFPELRRRTDVRAIELKESAYSARADLAKMVPEFIRTIRLAIHEGALALAALARFLERQAYRLADLVSHKRGFERRETHSEFLRKIAEHKNGVE